LAAERRGFDYRRFSYLLRLRAWRPMEDSAIALVRRRSAAPFRGFGQRRRWRLCQTPAL